MEHSEHYREKQYAADTSLGHREFWRMILAEVRAEDAAASAPFVSVPDLIQTPPASHVSGIIERQWITEEELEKERK